MAYAIIMCIIVVAEFVVICVFMAEQDEETKQRYFTDLDNDTQQALYRTPVTYDDDTQGSWRQRALVRDVKPDSDGSNADVQLSWYNVRPDKTTRATESGVDRVKVPKKAVKAHNVKPGKIVTIHVKPGEGVEIVPEA
ncbi:MAG: hypothetical protein UHD09_01250 [Bifidobacterium sp.]|nr:hypothetical protein [Bifidobacterium sp.]